ncbi:NAD(P)H-dependent oxidoreductase [Amycolatopsis sp. FU40]|uniref:NADPH-dependent FMN reductase n=1 Tax=Amycolatopsis sp. FU40 TaxID=2914159 RepID=UPI001F1A69C4|nr:NAD(P)H-dependent oxidoreductase [Amycolatopsis sp. FU40]UKD57068.1 NAD(P)H-dependent oxidoreductase [Amycolatopsis sp. FU40]
MTKIAVIAGSTHPGRVAGSVVEWVHQVASMRPEAEYEIVDLAEWNLPLDDEEIPAAVWHYAGEHTKKWAEKVASFDGFVVVTPEYNHAPSAAVKNAFAFVYAEWRDEAIGFVSYGGIRAVEQLKLVAVEVGLAPVSAQLALPIGSDVPGYPEFAPRRLHDL